MDIWVTARKFVHVSIWQVVILLINLFSMISFFPGCVHHCCRSSCWQNMFLPLFSKHPNASPSFTSKSKCLWVFFFPMIIRCQLQEYLYSPGSLTYPPHKRRQKWSFELEGKPPHQLDALGLTGIQEAGSSPHVRSWLGWTRNHLDLCIDFVAWGWIRNQIGRMSFQQILFEFCSFRFFVYKQMNTWKRFQSYDFFC